MYSVPLLIILLLQVMTLGGPFGTRLSPVAGPASNLTKSLVPLLRLINYSPSSSPRVVTVIALVLLFLFLPILLFHPMGCRSVC
ncbi:hypothetical protein BDV35DRAFT_274052 [Aspergillus flavus]|uniref:Secreted peptide n=1 Tax=Aspergillus flavus TaxID=5059 RepID=A0A5N6HBI7_ASPFL|nr:hypothetical protein BDV35DRAFT_274052 [Aspergillus flavus]